MKLPSDTYIMHNRAKIVCLPITEMQNTVMKACGYSALWLDKDVWDFVVIFFNESCKRNEFCNTHIVICGYDAWAEGQHSHLQHNMFKSNLYSCRSIMPKNVLASLALQISWCSDTFYILNMSLKCRKLLWHISQQKPKCSHAVCTPQSLESDQSDAAICASVKVSDYYTVDSSGWICVRLNTVSSNPDSLNQN